MKKNIYKINDIIEIDEKTMLAWIKSGAIKLVSSGEENLYFENEFEMKFFYKSN